MGLLQQYIFLTYLLLKYSNKTILTHINLSDIYNIMFYEHVIPYQT